MSRNKEGFSLAEFLRIVLLARKKTLGNSVGRKALTVSSIGARKNLADSGSVIKAKQPNSVNLTPFSERIGTKAPAMNPSDVD